MPLKAFWDKYCPDCGKEQTGRKESNNRIWWTPCGCKQLPNCPVDYPRLVKIQSITTKTMKGRKMEEKAVREGEIKTEFVRLNESKERLHERICLLFDRLKDILGPPNPQPESQTTAQQLTSPMAIDLSAVSATLETDCEKVNDILDRLEL